MDDSKPSKTGASPRMLRHLRWLVESGYIPTLEKVVKESTAAFWWDDADRSHISGTYGGTICFVDTGERLLGITAAHVHLACLEKQDQEGGELWCQIGGHSFEPEERLIDLNPTIDLATYDLSPIQVNAARANIHYAPVWPPEINDRDPHVIGGWPWILSRSGDRQITHKFLHFIAAVSSVSPENLGFITYTKKSIPWGEAALPPNTKLGGMSGGPVYRMDESGPIARPTLVGIIYQYQPGFEIVLARPLTLVRADGTITGV